MDIEKLFAEARRSPVSALRLGILIKDGEIELPIGRMLEALLSFSDNMRRIAANLTK